MHVPTQPPALLSGYRVLDLSDDRGLLCGRILGDMGADVIRVEPPTGNPARRVGPWRTDERGIEDSLVWQAWAASSRSLTLDVRGEEGRALLVRLLARADFLVESFDAGELDDLGLGEPELLAVNPSLVLVSITGFGATGPHAHFKAPDLVAMAMSGHAYLTGLPEGQPLRIGVPQAYANASASAAAGAMIAHTYRVTSGAGQRVDVSAQQSVARALAQAPGEWDLNRYLLRRQGVRHQLSSGVTIPLVWPCKDGFVSFILFGSKGGRSMNVLGRWMAEEGVLDDAVQGTDWEAQDFGLVTEAMVGRVQPVFEAFFRQRTKLELADGAAARGIMLYPLNTTEDLLEQVQLHAREFLMPWPGEASDRAVFPGGFVRASETPLRVQCPAPRLGQHTLEILGDELGMDAAAVAELRRRGVV